MASGNTLHFDPDLHPDDTLKAFNDFIQSFYLRYEAQYPDPPKVSIDAAIERWKLANEEAKPTLEQYDTLRNEWRSKDRVAKFLGMFSSRRMYADWQVAEPDVTKRAQATWEYFVAQIQAYYKPTENLTLKNHKFRTLTQATQEAFPAFCNRVYKEAQHCNFKCHNDDCTAEDTAIRDQIIIGTIHDKIREEALKHSWDLPKLRKEGMQIESATKGVNELNNENPINKMGKYSYKNLKKKQQTGKPRACYYCGQDIKASIIEHVKTCRAKTSKCNFCDTIGHYESVCRKKKAVRELTTIDLESQPRHEEDAEDSGIYNINIFRVTDTNPYQQHHTSQRMKEDFKVQVIVNNSLATVLADTGASISVCGKAEAKRWNLLSRMVKTQAKIKPYNSPPIPISGTTKCAVTFGNSSIPVEWHIIDNPCEPVLAGRIAEELGIIKFDAKPTVFQPVQMIHSTDNKETLQNILQQFPQNFEGLGKLKNHQVKLHVDTSIKPVTTPARPVPYHLKERVTKEIEKMIKQDVIEEHPATKPAPWISNAVIAPKADGAIRMTLDARNVNKAIQSSNLPIPRQEDIKAKLSGARVFSKMDFKSVFWQLELHPDSRYLTVFHANDKLYRYKRLTMGVKPAQGELNMALQPLFANIPQAHLIHDDLIVATTTNAEHNEAIEAVMNAISNAGITLNPDKCTFGVPEIGFWGLRIGSDGVRPDPAKVEALDHMTPPQSKEELNSFLCMLQSNSDFIPNFAQLAAKLRELTKKHARFVWNTEYQTAYEVLIARFKQNTLLQYFEMSTQTFLFTDAHQTGLGAMLAQGDSIENARSVAIASRTTNAAEQRYPQIDLEALAIDFALRRFRQYIVGSPTKIQVITDHQPLCSIFNGKRQGSIRTERIKLRHQDIRFTVAYQRGKINQSDYLSRHAKPIEKLTREERQEADDLNNLLYMLHTTPIIDCMGIGTIAQATQNDPTLKKIATLVNQGSTWIEKTESKEIQCFQKVLPELTMTANGIILKGDKIALPSNLQDTAIRLAHRGAHPGQSGLERRLRYHFFFHNMSKKIEEFVKSCNHCSMFIDKKTKEPIKPHRVPEKCWDTVSVDLFGPMPTSKHVVVVQDLASRFPAAKLVTSTKADKVLPALSEIYATYGNPEVQISDNGPPFNSAQMHDFATSKSIKLQKAPPLHPSSNPVETFMRPLGKAMKIAYQTRAPEKETLERTLNNYRLTPHPATGIPPAAMMFRDGQRYDFPRTYATEEDVRRARETDKQKKIDNEEKINSSKYRKKSNFNIGDKVRVRNYQKSRKFDPVFLGEPFKIIDINDEGNKLIVEHQENGFSLCRHPDDVKPFIEPNDIEVEDVQWPVGDEGDVAEDLGIEKSGETAPTLRRSERKKTPNPRYI